MTGSGAAIHIRRATEVDAAALADHRVSMFRDMGSIDPSSERVLREAAETEIRQTMVFGEYAAWVAHPAAEPTRIVGGAGVQLRRLLPRPADDRRGVLVGREGIVLNVYVERDHRRRGVARQLMDAIIAWVPETDIVRLVLHASDDGRALYERMGFEPTTEMRYTGELRRPT